MEMKEFAKTNRPTLSSQASQSLWTAYYIFSEYICYTI